jgi:hypothetical protein
MKTAIHRRMMCDAVTGSGLSLTTCHDLVSARWDFRRGARAARTGLTRLARWEVERGLLDRADEARERAARAELAALVAAALADRPARLSPRMDRVLYDLRRAAIAAGLDREARQALYTRVAGPPCDECGHRGWCDCWSPDDDDWSE